MERTLPLLFLLCCGGLSVQAQNTCATAETIVAGIHIVTAVNGTEIPTLMCADGGTNGVEAAEWFRYVPQMDTAVTINTELSGVDTRFHVYTGTCGAFTCVAGDDDSGAGNTSVATFNVEGGVAYTIVFDDRWTANGFQFTLGELAPIPVPEGLVTFGTQPYVGLSGEPFAAVDMNNDHLDDIVGVETSNITILRQTDSGFTPMNYPTTPADHTASWSLSAGDLDGNGYNDLQYGGYQGVTYMFANDDGSAFTETSFAEYVFSQRGNMVDINNDGALDAFMCHDVDANVYFMNDGNGNLSFEQGEFGSTCGNYGSIWVDYDGDGDQDLFVAKCGCDAVDIMMRNNGDGTFTHVASELGFADFHQSWSSAWGDMDNDGDMDVVVGSSSGDPHKVMRNNGDGTFTNVSMGSGLDTYQGSSNEWTTHDFNNDGYLDVLGGQGLHYGNGNLTFYSVQTAPYNGPIGDVNNDGFLDVLGYNAYYPNNGNENNWITVAPMGTVSNTNGIGARIRVTSALGSQIREIRSGDGFAYMSSLNAHFGLRNDTEVLEVDVIWPSGVVDHIGSPAINGTLVVVEGLHTGVGTVNGAEWSLYPNPATDRLTVTGPAAVLNAPARIIDATGKQVKAFTLRNGQVDISGLGSGVYVLSIVVDGQLLQQRFTKQ